MSGPAETPTLRLLSLAAGMQSTTLALLDLLAEQHPDGRRVIAYEALGGTWPCPPATSATRRSGVELW